MLHRWDLIFYKILLRTDRHSSCNDRLSVEHCLNILYSFHSPQDGMYSPLTNTMLRYCLPIFVNITENILWLCQNDCSSYVSWLTPSFLSLEDLLCLVCTPHRYMRTHSEIQTNLDEIADVRYFWHVWPQQGSK